jgi:hypothetical protein
MTVFQLFFHGIRHKDTLGYGTLWSGFLTCRKVETFLVMCISRTFSGERRRGREVIAHGSYDLSFEEAGSAQIAVFDNYFE